MRMSDDHAAKCSKLGKDFKNEYPEEFEEYKNANEEYNNNESQLLVLREQETDEEIIRTEI